MRETNPCFGCGCYDSDMGCTMPSIDKSYACPLKTDEGKFGITTHEIADILYNMSLDMDYMDYEEHWQEEINRIENELKMLKEFNSVLYNTLEVIAFININCLGVLTEPKA